MAYTFTKTDQMAAALSSFVYSLDPAKLPRGIEQWSLFDILASAIRSDPSLIEAINATHSKLFYWSSFGILFFVSRGTSNHEDWAQNVVQLSGESSDFNNTALIACALAHIARQLGIELIFCGHSKGGTQASLHGYITSHRAITFNSPGVSPHTKAVMASKLNISQTSLHHNNTISFVTDMDIVTSMSGLMYDNRDTLISMANGMQSSVQFQQDNFALRAPDGRQVQLSIRQTAGSYTKDSVAGMILDFVANSWSDGFDIGLTNLGTQLKDKHSMDHVLECMNSWFDDDL